MQSLRTELESLRDRPDEFPQLVALARRLAAQPADPGALAADEREVIDSLKARLQTFLVPTQKRVEEVLGELELVQSRGLGKASGAIEEAVTVTEPPSHRASSVGAYLAVSEATGAAETAPEPPVAGRSREVLDEDRYSPAAREAIDRYRAEIGQLTERLVEIQSVLATL